MEPLISHTDEMSWSIIEHTELGEEYDEFKKPLKDFEYATFYLRQDQTMRRYTRRTYDFLDWFGDLGGIQQLLWLIINAMIGFLI